MPLASVIVPASRAGSALSDTLGALSGQTVRDLEIIVVDHGPGGRASGAALEHVRRDPRIDLLFQPGCGQAGARNLGLAKARGQYIGFCSEGDLWHPEKLAAHVVHLQTNPHLGVSFARQGWRDARGRERRDPDRSRLVNVTAADLFRHDIAGHPSVSVLRREVLDDLAGHPVQDRAVPSVFEQGMRHADVSACWLRLMLTTDWEIEGIPSRLSLSPLNDTDIAATLDARRAAWEQMVTRLAPRDPGFFRRHTAAARNLHLQRLAVRALHAGERDLARKLLARACSGSGDARLHDPWGTAKALARTVSARRLWSRAWGPSSLSPLV